MQQLTAGHPFGPACDTGTSRHDHDWLPVSRTARRCSCGGTRFKIKVGGALPPTVVCLKCASPNRTASSWTEGYFAGVTARQQQAAL
jgi:hypothetical protein